VNLFRRRGRGADGEQDAVEGTTSEIERSETQDEGESGVDDDLFEDRYDDDEPAEEPAADRSGGPWDVAEWPEVEGYVDLGGIRLRGRDGMELRLELDEATGAVSSATVQLGTSAVQLQAFAAPRSEGIWSEIRAEIADGIVRQGGHADEVPGPFGRELIARIPARSPDGRTGHTAARFVGVDGPRWFLRAVFHGEAVHRPEAAATLEEVVRDVVVVRGPEAMAPRELLALRLPDSAGATAPEPEARDELRPFERGPEITEVR
jgi:Protein of unknown function (DUF3710)